MATEWRPVLGYEGSYDVSDDGQVRSVARVVVRKNGWRLPVAEKLLSINVDPNGRPVVGLYYLGQRKTAGVAVLMAEAFLGPRPEGMEVCHNNTINTDNRIENLRWDTHQENIRDIRRNGKGPAHRTHCPRGHEYTPENTYSPPGKETRDCRKCISRRAAEYKQRRKENA